MLRINIVSIHRVRACSEVNHQQRNSCETAIPLLMGLLVSIVGCVGSNVEKVDELIQQGNY